MAHRANSGQKASGKNGKRTDAAIVPPEIDSFSGVTYQSTADIVADARAIIESAHDAARRSVNTTLMLRNWYLGKRIAEEELKGADRAEYGKQVIRDLSKRLTNLYGTGFRKSALYQFLQFYRYFPNIFHTVRGQSGSALSWSHYRELLRVSNDDARAWYAREASEQGWSVRTLARNVCPHV